jgi:hypothetical protein
MMIGSILTTLTLAAAQMPYDAPVNPPDPTAHLAEMVSLYDRICLRAFPDDGAVAEVMTQLGATPLTPDQVEIYLHDDPGHGWRLSQGLARYDVTIEHLPYHACGVRTMTASGFPDMQAYQDLAARFEAGGGYQHAEPRSHEGSNVVTTLGGEQRALPGGAGESLFVALATPIQRLRQAGQTAVEVRFVHQIYHPPGQADPGAK